MTTQYEQQSISLENVINDAITLGCPPDIIEKIRELFESATCGRKIVIPRVQKVDNRFGVRWETNHGEISVVFLDDDQWSWTADYNVPRGGQYDDGPYSQHSQYSGGPSYTTPRGQHCYWLPDFVINIVKLPDEFEKQYSPIIQKYEYEVIWSTNSYDGMLAGYVRLRDHKLYYATCIDETEFERHRMFAIHKLTLRQRVHAWWRYHVWYNVLSSKILWKLWCYKSRIFKHKKEELTDGEIVGYFVR